MFRLSDELEAIEGADPNDLWPLHPDRECTARFEAARPIVDEIVSIVRSQNGDEISDEVILTKLLYGAAAIRIQLKIPDSELQDLVKRGAADLIDYKGLREVDVPLISLDLGAHPFTLGPVTFHPVEPQDKETDWWKWAASTLGDMTDTLLLSYARTTVRGDLHKSIKNAAVLVNEAILLLRGIGFPLTVQERHQFGILNEYPVWRNVPYRLGRPTETTHVDAQSRLASAIGPFRFPYDLQKDIISNTTHERISALLTLLAESGFSPKEEMSARVLSGFRWLGEATKPDAISARFAKVAFSLEAFVGGEAKDDFLTTRGITATLAERSAFLISNDLEVRMKVDRDIRLFYAKRSGIAHGHAMLVNPDDFEQFGLLVRELGWSLLDTLELFTTIDDLEVGYHPEILARTCHQLRMIGDLTTRRT